MNESGVRNQQAGVERIGFSGLEAVHWNWPVAALQEEAVRRGEGEIAADGPLAVRTGSHTGRSPKDKFVVRSPLTEDAVWWENNKEMSRAQFDRLFDDMRAHARGRTLFAQDLYGGADERYRISTRVFCEYAWHALFIRNLLIRPKREDLAGFTPELTIVDLPSFRADPERHGVRTQTVIACDFDNKVILIGGTSYAGEMKKSVFTVLNFFLPPQGVMPMHCSANMGPQGDVALFFGLSGTGKTTLSADPNRTLIGDDEHGWGEDGIFNFEGGCYAKMINLSAEAEPEIFSTTRRFGTVLENVVLDPETRQPQFDDASLTENTRGAYPIHFIPNASPTGRGGHPKNILMLTADAFGVLPPIARLTPSEAMVQFLSGYTAKVAGTEKGVEEPEATFSTCFGAPFMPRHPSEYGLLLRELIARHGADCWLVNTGWTGGAYGTGKRMPIAATRALLAAVLDGRLKAGRFRRDPVFGFDVPVSDDPAFAHLLDPRATWADKAAYDAQARKLVAMFNENFARFEAYVDAEVRAATPGRAAA